MASVSSEFMNITTPEGHGQMLPGEDEYKAEIVDLLEQIRDQQHEIDALKYEIQMLERELMQERR